MAHRHTGLPIKWQSLPLLNLVGPRDIEPGWYQNIRLWLQEDIDARTAGMPADTTDWVRDVRGRGRLQIE